jgi:hypothetical protein
LGGGREEGRAAFAVGDGDGKERATEVAEEDGAGGFGRVDNLDEGGATFEATGEVLKE